MDELFDFSIYADNCALIDGDTGRKISYLELAQEVRVAVDRLEKGKRLIFLSCSNTIPSVIEYLAHLQKGDAVCLLDSSMSSELKEALVRHYQREHTIIHPDLRLLLSTSGTTGSPKLIRLSKKNILSNANSICSYLKINQAERAVSSLPLHYSYGLSILHSHLLAGASIVLTQQSVLQREFWELFYRQQCTSFAGVPYTYQMLNRIGFETFDLPNLRTMTQAGGRLEKELTIKFHNIMAKKKGCFFTMYGQTEATARIAYLDPEFLPKKAGAIGTPIPGGVLKIYEGSKEIVQPYEVGELVYYGENVMLGYATGPDDLAKGDEQKGALHTGDLAYFDEEGICYISGRLKRISKVYGLRINLDELETKLRVCGPVAVTSNDQKIFIFFEGNLYPECIPMLAEMYKLHPSTFTCYQIDTLPLTSAGKIDYQNLKVP